MVKNSWGPYTNAIIGELDSQVTETNLFDEDAKTEYTGVGLEISSPEGDVLFKCVDILTDKAAVELFLARLIEHEAKLLHVDELLEDFLVEWEEAMTAKGPAACS